MKNILLILACTFSLSLSAAEMTVEIKNPLNVDRPQEPVAIGFEKLYAKLSQAAQISVYDGKTLLCSQLDDFDGDGKFDELSFLLDIKANETKTIRLTTSENVKSPCAENRVHAQLFLRNKENSSITPTKAAASPTGNLYNSLQHHGPAWETELIAYRAYFDQKQTIDVYGKYKRQMELAPSLWYPSDKQLSEQQFGDDILLVKGTVGVGTLKGWDGAKALHIAPVSNREARIVSAGPLRTVVDMEVEGWKYMNDSLTVINRYITYAGRRDVEVRVISDKPFAQDMQFCTGVQKIIGTEEFFSDKAGLACVWGTGFPVNDTVKYGKQTVGLAVAIPASVYNGDATSKIDHLTLLKPKGGDEFKYYFWVVSEKETWWNMKTAKAFFDYSTKEKHLMLNPLEVKIK
jgi:hypothetical protein